MSGGSLRPCRRRHVSIFLIQEFPNWDYVIQVFVIQVYVIVDFLILEFPNRDFVIQDLIIQDGILGNDGISDNNGIGHGCRRPVNIRGFV